MATEKRLIDANALVYYCKEIAKHEWNKRTSPVSWSDAYEGFIDDIDEMPTVDAVEVVRCKDCKHRYSPNNPKSKPFCTKQFLMDARDDDFCSCGERKDNG